MRRGGGRKDSGTESILIPEKQSNASGVGSDYGTRGVDCGWPDRPQETD